MKRVWATIVSQDAYLPGALVLAHCLEVVKSKYPLVVLATPSLSQHARTLLTRVSIPYVERTGLYPSLDQHDPRITDDRFEEVWTKLRVFELTEYDRIILIDSDMIVFKNMDELFDLPLAEGEIAATYACACNPRKKSHFPSDWRPENCAYTALSYPSCLSFDQKVNHEGPRAHRLLNSGLVVLEPSDAEFERIKAFLNTSPVVRNFIFPDQDLLAEVFKGRWRPLPFVYNALKPLRTIHTNIWKKDEDIYCLHYILVPKPWDCVYKPNDNSSEGVMNRWWWEKYDQMLKSKGSTLREDGIEGEEPYLATLVARRTSKDGVLSKPH